MSYEGYEQYLCGKGHTWTRDCWDTSYEQAKCPVCSTNAVWWNAVNTTNGSFDIDSDGNKERIDGYVKLEVLDEAVVCVCSCCNNAHIAKPATYKLPSEDVGHHEKSGLSYT